MSVSLSDSTDTLPEVVAAEAGVSFRDLNLSAPLLQAVEASGYETATPIQAGAIPLLLAGRDLLGQAQTGTGKTAAFALPMLERIDLAQRTPQVLVLTPTRELAIQVAEAFERYASGLSGLHVASIYGGQDYSVQFRQLDRGVHVVVGTPGRVMDHIRRGSLKLDLVRGIVLDEADEMLRMGFAEDVEWVLSQAPAERQIALFSATLPAPIRKIAEQHLRNPAEITIAQKTATADTVEQRYVVVLPHQKQAVLARLLETERIDGVLIFVKMKSTTEPLADYLATQGYRTAALSSDIAQKQRERIMENMKGGKIDVIVATDVAARGLDVDRLSHVINYDLPFDNESYVHRIGRTGRAGRAGIAIMFLHPRERHLLKRLERSTRQLISAMEIPSKRELNRLRVARFHERITAGLAHKDFTTFTSLVAQYRAENPDVPLEQVAASLIGMAMGDTPLLATEELKPVSFSGPEPRTPGAFGRRDGDRRDGDRRTSSGPHSERGAHPPNTGRSRNSMETFRIEVGTVHGAKPANIVGAIANETGLTNQDIGRIEIFEDFSTVDLLVGMPNDMFYALKKVRVAGRQLNISRTGEGHAPPVRFGGKKFKKNKKPG